MPKLYLQEFEVEGSGSFPVDMLRYDSCWPASSVDAHAMSLTQWDKDERWTERRKVKLKRYVLQKKDEPTADRWSSFLWAVVRNSVFTREA